MVESAARISAARQAQAGPQPPKPLLFFRLRAGVPQGVRYLSWSTDMQRDLPFLSTPAVAAATGVLAAITNAHAD